MKKHIHIEIELDKNFNSQSLESRIDMACEEWYRDLARWYPKQKNIVKVNGKLIT